MSVRHATEDDMGELLELGRLMHAEGPAFGGTTLDLGKGESSFRAAMADGLFLVNERSDGKIDGMLAGFILPRWYALEPVFCDLVFFVHPDSRATFAGARAANKLVHSAIEWCRLKGLRPQDVTIGVSSGVRPEHTGKLLEQAGFRSKGGIYQLGSY